MSFTELMTLFNTTFNLRDTEQDSLLPLQVDQLIQYVAKIALDNQKNNFDMKVHFKYPLSSLNDFVWDLKREPLLCDRQFQGTILEELGKRYRAGEGLVSTQQLQIDIEAKVERQREKNILFTEIRKQVNLKNMKIETVFN